MALVRTKYHKLPTWALGDKPGAGPQPAGAKDNMDHITDWDTMTVRLNEMIMYLDEILKYLNSDGTLKEGAFDLTTIPDLTDGTTLEKNVSNKYQIKDSGVVNDHFSNLAITSNKLSRDNKAKKYWLTFAVASAAVHKYFNNNGAQLDATLGIIPTQAVRVTAIRVRNSSGDSGSVVKAYSAAQEYSTSDRLAIRCGDTAEIQLMRNGAVVAGYDVSGIQLINNIVATVELEYV